jgi:hypothetical protein
MAFPTTGVLDTFTRADEGPPPSSSWTDAWIDASGGLVTQANGCRRNTVGAGSDSSYWNVADFGPDCEVHAKLSKDTGASGEFALALRLVNIGVGTTDGYGLDINLGGDGTHYILRYDNQSPSAVGASISQAWTSGDSFGFEAIGTTLKVYYKPAAGSWTEIASRTDGTYTAAGKIGLAIAGGAGTNNDGVADDFGGGTVSGGAPSGVLVQPPVRRVF